MRTPTDKTVSVRANRPKVFICHAKDDSEKAEKLYELLLIAETDPWLDKRKLVLGDNWEQEIKKAVAAADAFVVCLRPGFDEVGFRQQEVRWAIEALRTPPSGPRLHNSLHYRTGGRVA